MTFLTLKAAVRAQLLDASGASPDYWTDARLDPIVNAAMQNVANAMMSQNPAYFHVEADVTIANPDSLPWVTAAFAAPYTTVRRIVNAYVKGYTGSAGFIDVTDLASAHRVVRGAALLEKPPIFLSGTTIGFVYPKNAIEVHVSYVAEIPYMTDATDTPGQVGGAGTANLLPVGFHHLITDYATIVCLAAMSLPTTVWQGLLIQEAQLLGLSLLGRRETPEGPQR